MPANINFSRFINCIFKALHLLEYGIGWVYLNQKQISSQKSSLKQQLNELHKRIDSIDSELLFSGSLTDSKQLIKSLKLVEKLQQTIINNFVKTTQK